MYQERQTKKKLLTPFLKWAGGKRWLVERIPSIFNLTFNKYIEPFIGAGSVFFHLRPDKAILSDSNGELMGCYEAIKKNWGKVFKHLQNHKRNHSKDYYYDLRSSIPPSISSRAARLIYLNRTCFNGIYRVNRNGVFNVPKGARDSVILNTDNFEAISCALQNAELIVCDFEESVNRAKCADLVFADPPYTVRHNNNAFVKYNEKLFSWEDQVRLSKCLKKAASRGVKIIATNAYHPSVIELYQGAFELSPITRKSHISADRRYRGSYKELLIQANN